MTDLDGFFAGREVARSIFDALCIMIATIGQADVRVSKSQVAFARQRIFARVWLPDQYLGPGHAPLVLTLALRRRDLSPRWKQVVEPARGRFTHHLELHSPAEIDNEVDAWLRQAWATAA